MRFGVPICILPKNKEKAKIKINIDYDAYILSLIKTGLSAENQTLFKELFEKPTPKLYSTSVFFPNATFTKDSIILDKSGEMKLYFSTSNTNLAINFYNSFIYLNHLDAEKLPFGHEYLADVKKLYTIELPTITKIELFLKQCLQLWFEMMMEGSFHVLVIRLKKKLLNLMMLCAEILLTN